MKSADLKKWHHTSKSLKGLLVAGLLAATGTPALSGEITIYATMDGDKLKKIGQQFEEAHPEIKVNWVRDSTGIIDARLRAEKDNPRADVIYAMAATSMLSMDQLGMFLPYTPKGVENLDAKYRDSQDPPHWTGIYGWASAICFNTVEAEKLNIPRPTKWTDLTDPVYRGQITMPNPVSGGTGFLAVSSWIQMFGEEKAWEFMDGLHENIASYAHGGSKPCNQAAAGEYVVGISWPFRGATLKTKGAPIDVIVPEEGIGWEMQAMAILKGTKNEPDAKTFIDWAINEDIMRFYASSSSVVAMPGMTVERENFPPEVVDMMINNDFVWAADNKARINTEWRGRYDGKSEPKN